MQYNTSSAEFACEHGNIQATARMVGLCSLIYFSFARAGRLKKGIQPVFDLIQIGKQIITIVALQHGLLSF